MVLCFGEWVYMKLVDAEGVLSSNKYNIMLYCSSDLTH